QPHLLSGLQRDQIGAASSGANQRNRPRAAQPVRNLHTDAVDLSKGKPWCRCWFRINPPAAQSDDCATVLSGRQGHRVTLQSLEWLSASDGTDKHLEFGRETWRTGGVFPIIAAKCEAW